MKSSHNNSLRRGALFSLYATSYLPLFAIFIVKQIKEEWNYFCWGGFNIEAIICFVKHFGMSALLVLVSIMGIVGLVMLLRNLKKDLPNGEVVKVTKINNRNSEAVGYIATYIVPFLASDFSSLFECVIFMTVMGLIYTIYTNSNMILINPILNMRYSLLEIEYKLICDPSGTTHDALVITDTKDYKENVDYQIYQIGFKLYYGKERR